MSKRKKTRLKQVVSAIAASIVALSTQSAKTADAPVSVSKNLESVVLPAERSAGKIMYVIGSTLMKNYTDAIMERLNKNAKIPPAFSINKGSTRGIEVFCDGIGLKYPDVVSISRRMRANELEDCRAHGVNDIVEIQIGFEATGIVSRHDDQDYKLTLSSLYKGVAREIPSGSFVPNKNNLWSEADSNLPNTPIKFVIPVPSLGGRAFFEDRILQGACRNFKEIKGISDAKDRVKQCITLRKDGRIVELDVPYDINVVNTIAASVPGALAVVPLRFATENKNTLKLQPIDGVLPNRKTVADHSYHLTRPLYYLIKRAHIKDYYKRGLVDGLREFITEVTREATIGPDGYVTKMGVFPLEDEMREEVRAASLRLETIDR
jgi:phosphate transport system substrate-binding protein